MKMTTFRRRHGPILAAWLLGVGASIVLPFARANHSESGHGHNPEVLNALLIKVVESVAKGEKPMVLFDIDDTLTATDGRHRRIIREFADDAQMANRYPKEDMDKLRNWVACSLQCRPLRYDVTDTARAAGISNEALLKDLFAFWGNPAAQTGRFFDKNYIPEDLPNPGAVEYVKAVIEAGGTAAYFTGRKAELIDGTIAALRKHGFPVPGEKGAVLFLKQNANQRDVDFKAEKIRELVANHAVIIGGFDNEPENINAFRKEGPADSLMVFLDTKHSPKGDQVAIDPSIDWVKDFVRPAAKQRSNLLELESRQPLRKVRFEVPASAAEVNFDAIGH